MVDQSDLPHVVIAGGGITGLAAAYTLSKERIAGPAAAAGPQFRCTLVEADTVLGGKVRTEHIDGLDIEQGPDSFLVRKPHARQLCLDLGLESELIGTNPAVSKTYMVHRRRLEPLPPGMMLVAPVSVSGFLGTRLLSPWGKLRAGLDLLLPAAQGDQDESLGGFISRRLGSEVAQKLAGPLLAGIYAGDADQLSLLATFPQLRQLERRHGSLLRGLAQMGAGSRPQSGTGSAFQTLRGGLGRLVEVLTAALAQPGSGVRLLCDTRVTDLGRRPDSGYRVRLNNGEELSAAAVILAIPAFAAAELLVSVAPAAAGELSAVPYASTAVVALAYPAGHSEHPLDATGFLVPKRERRVIAGSTWVSVKWPEASSNGQILIRCFVGRAGDERILADSDSEIIAAVHRELTQLMHLHGPPTVGRVYRWPRGMPQYTVGHPERMQRVAGALSQHPALVLAGSGYGGLGLPDCIRQGREAAARVLSLLPLPTAAGSP